MFLNRLAPLLIAFAALGFTPLAQAQVAPSPQQNAGFALADQIRANRTQSVTYATNYQQQQQNQQMISAQTAANEIAAQQAAQQAAQSQFAVQPNPEGGVTMSGPVFGPGLISSVPGGNTTNNITLQINIQNGNNNVGSNGSIATQTSASR